MADHYSCYIIITDKRKILEIILFSLKNLKILIFFMKKYYRVISFIYFCGRFFFFFDKSGGPFLNLMRPAKGLTKFSCISCVQKLDSFYSL